MHPYEQAIRKFNEQLSPQAASYQNLESLRGETPDGIVAIGMGGSGLVGDLLRYLAVYAKIEIPITSWKDFNIPSGLPFKRPLYLVTSFSGNTAETLDAFNKLVNQKPTPLIAVIAGGGKLAAAAAHHGLPHATFATTGLVPRQATGLMLYASLGILKALWPTLHAPDLRKSIRPADLASEGTRLAKKLEGKTVLVYATGGAQALGYHWKTKLNETGKVLSYTHTIPELIHNELVSFQVKPKGVAVLILTDSQDGPEVQKVVQVLTTLLTRYGTKPEIIEPIGANAFEQAANSLILADWTSYHLALAAGVDPQETSIIVEVKKLQA